MPNRLDAREADLLVSIQKLSPDWAQPVARGLSFIGEHALGWMALSAAGYVANLGEEKNKQTKRREWLAVGTSAFASHAASVVIKRIVRRRRPADPRIKVGVSTPSRLSFPSSHATSTTAFLVALSHYQGTAAPLVGVPIMMLSRMVLGVHYPTDTVAGAALGAVTARTVYEIERQTR